MAAINPRINVTFEEATAEVFSQLASQEHKSIASVVRDLALEALERREDRYLSDIAEKLDKKNAKTYSHTQAWK
jgi:hypothetical protein